MIRKTLKKFLVAVGLFDSFVLLYNKTRRVFKRFRLLLKADTIARAVKVFPKLLNNPEAQKALLQIVNQPGIARIDYFKELEKQRILATEATQLEQQGRKLRLDQTELLSDVRPCRFATRMPITRSPPRSVCFATVTNSKFLPGVEALVLSLSAQYPSMECDFHIFHDGSLSQFAQARLLSMYRHLKFSVPDMAWFTNVPSRSDNHRRIGTLGYMNIMALALDGYERVVILDADLLITGDISAFWFGEPASGTLADAIEDQHVIACHDIGQRPYIAQSRATQKQIINSGVISVPRRFLTEECLSEIKALTMASNEPVCALLDRYADQKVWNQFLADKPVQILPTNYNCNAKYFMRYLGAEGEFVSVLHFTGVKPWFSSEYLSGELLADSNSGSAPTHTFWLSKYRRDLAAKRLDQYRAHRASAKIASKGEKKSHLLRGKPGCFFIGNGPSLAQTDLSKLKGYETFAFNWFVNHEEFDAIRPDNLVFASHMLFGGWNTQDPALPESLISALRSKVWKPKLWISFYFKEYIETSGLDRDFEVDYILFEKPFKYFVDKLGTMNLSLDAFLQDGRTGVLSAALPIAVTAGYRNIGLVGCDSNYNQIGGGNYFYDDAKHQSLSTRSESLTSTWTASGRGHLAYTVAQRELERIGGSLIDFTLGGTLPLPKGHLAQLSQ